MYYAVPLIFFLVKVRYIFIYLQYCLYSQLGYSAGVFSLYVFVVVIVRVVFGAVE